MSNNSNNLNIYNMKHNKVNQFFSKLVIVFAFLLVTNMFSQRLIDTNEKYEHSIYIGKGLNDCSVRALASLDNIQYNESYNILKSLGRKDNEGFDLRIILQHLQNNNRFNNMTPLIKDKGITIRQLINANVLNKNVHYLVMSEAHIFTVKFNGKYWVTYGNYNDLDNVIFHLISINKLG